MEPVEAIDVAEEIAIQPNKLEILGPSHVISLAPFHCQDIQNSCQRIYHLRIGVSGLSQYESERKMVHTRNI